MPIAVFALALCGFGIGTTEFVVMGLLPEVARDLEVGVTTAGVLISGYAVGVVFGGPLLVALGIRVPRKRMLLALMAIFVVGNLVSALAPGYALLMTGRVATAVCHGAFLGLASVVAADLADSGRTARAVALVFAGGAIANVVGAPLGTFVGQNFGWRTTFWMLVVIGLVGFAGIARLVPHRTASTTASLRDELVVFRRPQVALGLAMTALSIGALFTSFTYVAPMLTEVTGYAESALTPLLVLFGVGLVAGNTVGGKLGDRIGLIRTLALALGALTVVLAVFTVTAHSKVPAAVTLLLVGFAGFATVPGLMTRVIGKAVDAPTLAAVVTVSASNVGIALGAWLGGVAIDANLGYTAPNWLGAMMAGGALLLTLLSGALDRRAPLDPAEPVAAEPRPATS
ncbi:DHA1 family inner membrane transport protein [Saccharothrix tamanrassetensis]|uniref:DHA1 family inner membrane transport protein n=1 Tax=Saccharothrix tamanrassetensis TaxID=1051531 RepID=A0A841C556_9PSEU|nr:MFS transporter [Saccharothrix tamanrassetensis]MBB5953662.1 DHA1 family inner membrane transport protein [Saccharothrix tamanrassetensis]